MAYRLTFFLVLNLIHFSLSAHSQTDVYLRDILHHSNYPVLQKVIKDPMNYRCQVIYTEINRDKKNRPTFKNYYFNYDPKLYFNPASIVKLPLAFLSLEKLNRLSNKKIDKYSI